ncbi:hypothetical protein MP228_007430 [Amoeboaphelidium protococcarum]|nr:hypothetical protein MP228_007430 [Amoeboaphelidium protococcarum]
MPPVIKSSRGKQRVDPMARAESSFLTSHKQKKDRQKFKAREEKRLDKSVSAVIDSKSSRKILEQARAQMEELEDNEGRSLDINASDRYSRHQEFKSLDSDEEDDAYGDDSADEELQSNFSDFHNFDEDAASDLGDLYGEYNDISAQDRDALNLFMPDGDDFDENGADFERVNLSSIVMSKLREMEDNEQDPQQQQYIPPNLTPKVVEVYGKVGLLLARYRSGKLPKAFKIIPSLANWEDILYLTAPENWSPAAVLAATKMFSSNLKPKMAQRFYNLILLDHVRSDMGNRTALKEVGGTGSKKDTRIINPHLFEALKKALYKPAAWFKGILLPLCGVQSRLNPNADASMSCTLREALVVSSVLKKISVPLLHSAAALMKLSQIERYNGANSIFMRVLLDKKYALPYRVIDSIVEHFLRFRHGPGDDFVRSSYGRGARKMGNPNSMPVIWHQCLLTFCQRYKEDMSPEQKEAVLELIKVQNHHQISPEVRRELVNSRCRGDDNVVAVDGDYLY